MKDNLINKLIRIYLLCIFFFSTCTPSPEEKKKRDAENLKEYLSQFRMLYSRAQPFYNKLNKITETLQLPKNDILIFEYKPDPLLDLEMKTSNAVWFQVGEKKGQSNFSTNFKLVDLIPGGLSTFAVNILDGIKEKMTRDSSLLVGKDTSGLEMFVNSLNAKRTPYAIFLRELKREDTEVEKTDFSKYSFDGGGILLAIWIADIEKGKIIGSYLTEIRPQKAHHISSFNDTTPEKEKMEDMKVAIYREACFIAFQNISKDIKEAQRN